MKERIEQKLGCTIEEYINRKHEVFKKYEGYEADGDLTFPELTIEELDFITEYLKQKIA